MIAFLEGILEFSSPTKVVLNVAGVGYDVAIPVSSYESLPKAGGSCRLLTHPVYREDSQTLYGFGSAQERDMFRLLLAVNGIGPKIAISAISGLSPKDLVAAILDGDVKRISGVPGIGKKTAERVIVELRDKIDPADAIAARSKDGDPEPEGNVRDAVMALVSLGYKQVEAAKMLKAVTESSEVSDLSVEDLIRRALSG